MYDANGRLTRAGAMQIIKNGGSVCIRGVVVSDLSGLPSEAAFAKGNPQAEEDAKRRLQQTIADAQKQLLALDSGIPGTITAVKPDSPPPTLDLNALTVLELKKLASEQHVPGYGTMNKEALVAALSK